MSEIVQFVGFLLGPPIKPVKEITSLANSITNPFKKEIKECGC